MARKTFLEEAGYEITAHSNPEEGLAAFQNSSFDVLITDFRMPRLNGRQLIAEVRRMKPDMSIILISGMVDALGLNEQNTGADVVIPKNNTEVTHLTRAVARLLRTNGTPKKPSRSQGSVMRAKASSI